VVRTLGLPEVAEAEIVATGTSTEDLWSGVAFEAESGNVIFSTASGVLYQLDLSSKSLNQLGKTGLNIYDIQYGPGGLYAAYALNGVVAVSSIDLDTLKIGQTFPNIGAAISDSVSITWDRFGYFLYSQSYAGLVRYDPMYDTSVVLCPSVGAYYATHGMFMDFSGSVIMMLDPRGNELPLGYYTRGFCESDGSTAADLGNKTAFTYYKFDSAELCFVGSLPESPVVEGVPINTGAAAAVPLFPGANGNTIVESAFSTLAVGGGGAAVVGFFAIFAVVVGVNNTKKEPEVPISALLQETGASTAAFENPTFTPMAGPNHNILAGGI